MTRRASQLCISGSLLHAVAAHAVSEFPRECCGLLMGSISELEIEARLVVPAANIARMPDRRYQLDWGTLAAGLTGHNGPRVVGFYHSHPDGSVAPSPLDAESAWPGYVYLIVGVTDSGPAGLAAWRKPDTATATKFEPLHIASVPPHSAGA